MNCGNFSFHKTKIEGVIIVEPKKFEDKRGYFMETYHKEAFRQGGIIEDFVQDNHSKSTKGVLRGLHFQTENIQAKLVRVISGEVFDVAVDLRSGSRTFGKWIGVTLNTINRRQLFVPKGFAHGYLVMSEEAEFVYKCTDYYNPNAEGGVRWNDPQIGIDWPLDGIEEILLSKKDATLPLLSELDKIF